MQRHTLENVTSYGQISNVAFSYLWCKGKSTYLGTTAAYSAKVIAWVHVTFPTVNWVSPKDCLSQMLS